MTSLKSLFRMLDFTSINQILKSGNGRNLILSKSCENSPEALIALYNLRANVIPGHVKRKYVYSKKGGDVKSIVKAFGRKLEGGLGTVASVGLTAVCVLSPKYVVHAYYSPESNEIEFDISENRGISAIRGNNKEMGGVILSVHGVPNRGKSLEFFSLARKAVVSKGHELIPIRRTSLVASKAISEIADSPQRVSEVPNIAEQECAKLAEVKQIAEEPLDTEEPQQEEDCAPHEKVEDRSTFTEKCVKLTMLIVVYDVLILTTYYTCQMVFA
eukprot:Nk52_evm60s230 gene=Nk52_evmTU60s230